jgi:hypothetical protein
MYGIPGEAPHTGLLALDDPHEWDAAYESGRDHLGTAVIGLALNCPPADAAPRILAALRLRTPVSGGSRSRRRGTRRGSTGS